MNVAAVPGLVGADGGFEVNPTMAADIDDFLLLLVEQLRGQDPLEPLDNESFVTQLVQFSSLQHMTEQNAVMQLLTEAQIGSVALSLLGSDVEYVDESGDLKRGTVTQVKLAAGGQPILVVDGSEVYLGQVTSVSRPVAGA